MDTRYSNDDRSGYYGYPDYCGQSYWKRNRTTPYRREYVTSYRGKQEYIQVGTKRRKAFHSFRRYKHLANDAVYGKWCPSGGIALEGWDIPLSKTLKLSLGEFGSYGYWDLVSRNHGTDIPPICEIQLQELGEELREFVIRDLYIKAVSPRFDGAVFLAELGETLASIHLLLSGTVNSLLKSRTAWKHLKHIVLHPEEMWLWWRYALMPAMMDVEDMIAAIKPQVRIDRVQDGDRPDVQRLYGTCYDHGMTNVHPSKPEAWGWKSEVRAGLGGAIDIYQRSDPHEFGTSNWDVVRAAWEIIPFSFIADWFVNVGDWLASLRSLEIEYAQSYCTFAISSETTLLPGDEMILEGTPKVKTFLMERIVNLEPPSAPLVDRRWQNCLRTIDLISLTVGILRGVLNRRK